MVRWDVSANARHHQVRSLRPVARPASRTEVLMKRKVMVVVAVLLGLTAARGGVQAQTPAGPTVDQIIEKHIAAVGGRAAMEKITSRVSKGSVEIPDMGMSGSINIS